MADKHLIQYLITGIDKKVDCTIRMTQCPNMIMFDGRRHSAVSVNLIVNKKRNHIGFLPEYICWNVTQHIKKAFVAGLNEGERRGFMDAAEMNGRSSLGDLDSE